MIKYGILLFNLLGVLFYQLFFSEQVTVSNNIPETIKAGSEFHAEVIVNKGSIGGFSKLQLEIPQGFTVVEEESKGATFSFSNQVVKFIWTALPSESEMKISFKVLVDKSTSGQHTITGKFSYVENNARVTSEMPAATITVTSDPVAQAPPAVEKAVEAAPIVAESKKPEETPPSPNQAPANPVQEVKCERLVPTGEVEGEFTVEVTITKAGNLSGYAKLHETIPNGLVADELESGGATFSFSEQTAKFVWVSLPTDKSELKVSYKLKPLAGVAGPQTIQGVFSYLENEQDKKITINASTVTIKGNAPVSQSLTNSLTSAPTPTPTEAVPPPQPVAATPAPEPTTPVVVDKEERKVQSPAVSNVPAPQTGVKYKVQIAASHLNKTETYFRSKYGLSGKIDTELHEGWSKYTIGDFAQYKQAHDQREEVKNKGVEGPFVTAYQSGKRITVQEAMMITSQQWYK